MQTQIIRIASEEEARRDLATSARTKELVRERRKLIAEGRASEALTDEQIIDQVRREMESKEAETKAAPAGIARDS